MLDLMGLGWLNDLLLASVVGPLARLTMTDVLESGAPEYVRIHVYACVCVCVCVCA